MALEGVTLEAIDPDLRTDVTRLTVAETVEAMIETLAAVYGETVTT